MDNQDQVDNLYFWDLEWTLMFSSWIDNRDQVDNLGFEIWSQS